MKLMAKTDKKHKDVSPARRDGDDHGSEDPAGRLALLQQEVGGREPPLLHRHVGEHVPDQRGPLVFTDFYVWPQIAQIGTFLIKFSKMLQSINDGHHFIRVRVQLSFPYT